MRAETLPGLGLEYDDDPSADWGALMGWEAPRWGQGEELPLGPELQNELPGLEEVA